MADFTISTRAAFLNQRRNLADLQSRILRSAQELSTGKKARPVRELGLDYGVLLQLRRKHDGLVQFQKRIDLIDTRLDVTQTALTAINGGLERLPEDILTAAGRGDITALLRTAAEGGNLLSGAVSALNVTIGGRYLFSGDDVQAAPLADRQAFVTQIGALLGGAPDISTGLAAIDDFFADTAPGTFTGTLYQGGDGPAPIAEIAEGERLTYGIKANQAPLRDLLQGLSMLGALADGTVGLTSPDLEAFAARAAEKIRQGRDGITLMRADLGAVQQETGRAKTAHDATMTVLALRIIALEGRDPNEAATEFQILESQLQASYLITGRLAQLRLTNFI